MNEQQKKYFGTDGIRGVANTEPLDPESLVRLGKAIAASFLSEERAGHRYRVLIGKDTRLSGYMIETALASGITSMGMDVLLVGPIPTPGVAYLTRSMRADAGIMISASHNSYEDNGIKLFAADGYKLPDERELEIEALLQPGALDSQKADGASIGKATRIDDALGRYTVELKSCFPRELTLDGMKIGIDAANGAGYIVGPQMLYELGAEVVSRGVSPNGRNINAGFGSLYPEVVRELVLEQRLDVGLALDGDGDRLILIDEKGQMVDGDAVLAICALDLKRRGLLPGGKVVGTVMSNLGLEKLLKKNEVELIRAAVGDRYVLEEMTRCESPLGGEQSGHTIFGSYSTTGDGLLTALMVLAVMQREDKPLSELAAEYVRYPQKLVNVKVRDKPPLDSIPEVKSVIEKTQSELADTGRLLVRYSGTENKARVMVECDTEENCVKYAKSVAAVIEQELGTV